MRRLGARAAVLAAVLFAAVALRAGEAPFDVVIRGGTVYDGTGSPGRVADVGIRGDKVAAVGDLSKAAAARVVDAKGMAVAPGFVNMLSWSTESLIVDGRSQSELRQGITTQIFGEGFSMGPLNERLRKFLESQQTDFHYEMPWTTLAEYLAFLEKRGISQNVASYIGATTLRAYTVGFDKRAPTPEELDTMRELVRREMEAGALGIGSALIYAPGNYATTEELIELCKVAAKYQGKYISHMRSEADGLLEAVDELIRISREAGLPAEIYHLKAAGEANWPKMDKVIARVEEARRQGLKDLGQHVPVHRGRNEPRRVRAALGARRRQRRDDRPLEGPGGAGKDRGRDAPAGRWLGEHLPPDGLAVPGPRRRRRSRGHEAPAGEDPRRHRQRARQGPGGRRDRSGRRVECDGGRPLLPDVRGQREEGDHACPGCRSARTRTRRPPRASS